MKRGLILFGWVVTLATTTQAVEIRNVTSNSVVFYDDFENLSITPSTANAYDGTQDADPIAKVGSWTVLEGVNDTGDIQVTTYTNPQAAPVPFQGSRDLRVFRDSTHNGQDLVANLTSPQTHSGDLIHLSMRVYIPTSQNVDARAQFFLLGSALTPSSARARFRPNGAGFVAVGGPSGFTPTTVPYLTDTWQEWAVDYLVGASTFNFSVGGVSGSGTSFSSGDVGGFETFNGDNTVPGSFFLDAPEPTSVALLALGSLMLWRTRGRSSME